jgi:hypothetical protein
MSPCRRLARTHLRLRSSALRRCPAATSGLERIISAAASLAVVLGNVLLRRDVGQLSSDDHRLLPILLELVDFQQVALGIFRHRRITQLLEDLLGPVEQTGLQIVLSEFGQRLQLQVLRQIVPLDQTLMHANRALRFPAPTK